MATQTVAPDVTSTRTIQVPATAILPQVQPVVSVGELVRFVVRENQNGLGQLYMRGLLIKASLPPDLATGDRVLAKVTEANDTLVLRILDAKAGPTEKPLSGMTASLSRELDALMKQLGTADLRPSTGPLATSASSPSTPQTTAINNRIRELLAALGLEQELGRGTETFKKLMAATDGSLAAGLRNSANGIRSLLAGLPSPAEQTLLTLQSEIGRLLSEGSSDKALALRKQIDFLLSSLTEQTKTNRNLADKERAVMAQVREQLLNSGETVPELKEALKQAQTVLNNGLTPELRKNGAIDSHTASLLFQLSDQLEQLAQTQERLNQLNPLMQALGEPALILFPFLAQGLLSHSEVTVQSRNEGRKRRGNKNKDSDEGSEANHLPFQRIQVSVPLPMMGTVDVDIAHRQNEILVRFTVEDADVGAFLVEQLEHLAGVLRAQNFARAELVTHVGKSSDHTPNWAVALRATTSIFA